MIITLLAGSGWAMSRMPPCWMRGWRSVRPGARARLGVALGDVDALDHDGTPASGDVLLEGRAPKRLAVFLQPCGLRRTRCDDDRACRHPCRSVTSDLSPGPDVGHARAAWEVCAGGHHSTSGASETIFM